MTPPVNPEQPNIEGIVLAAGLSSRMGRPKLLLEIDGVPLFARVIRAALGSRLGHVIVVLGPSLQLPPELKDLSETLRLQVATNPHPERGMSTSVRTGLAELSPSASGVMVLLADQPWLTSKVIDTLIDSFSIHREKIIAPTIHGRRSNPVVFPRKFLKELEKVTGDTGGKSVLNRNAGSVVLIEMGSFYNDADLDTPDDVVAARERCRLREK